MKYRTKRRKLVTNPFVSKAQRRACYAKGDPDWDCDEWEGETPSKIPERKPIANCQPGQLRDSSGKCGPGVGLSIPREEMPQIPGEQLQTFVGWAQVQGTSVTREIVVPDELSPTQSHFRQSRVDAIPDEKLLEPILVSEDDYILDGTHRWVKHWQRGSDVMSILRIGLPLRGALALMKRFPGSRFVTNTEIPKARKRLPSISALDPTRTGVLRKEFAAHVGKQFNTLKARLLKLIVDEDVLGLKPREPGVFNVFCPTGQGGGVDPTCSPGGEGKGKKGRKSKARVRIETPTRRDEPHAVQDIHGLASGARAFDKYGNVEAAQALREEAHWRIHDVKRVREKGEEIAHIFGKNEHGGPDVASAVGAVDEATVRVSHYSNKEYVAIEVVAPQYRAMRHVTVDPKTGEKVMHNDSFFMVHETGTGLGLKVFRDQVDNLRDMGFSHIETWAARGTGMNGYYTWPRFGYDQKISDFRDKRTRERILNAFPNAKSVLDITETPEGRAWWKKNGTNMRKAVFDLKEGSRSLKVLEGYLAERATRKPTRNLLVNEGWPVEPDNEDNAPPPDDQREEVGDADEIGILGNVSGDVDTIGNVFCPTGKGGGINPTCSPGNPLAEIAQHGTNIAREAANWSSEKLHKTAERISRIAKKSKLLRASKAVGKFAKALTAKMYQKLEQRHGRKAAIGIFAAGQVLSWGAFAVGAATGTVIYVPSAVATAPFAAIAEVYRAAKNIKEARRERQAATQNENEVQWYFRMAEGMLAHLHSEMAKAPKVQDEPVSITLNAPRWAFVSSPEQILAFQEWLKTQLGDLVTSKSEEELWRLYAESGYRKGAGRAFDDVKVRERALAITDEKKRDFYQGGKEQFLRDSFAHPISVEKVKLLAARSFTDLKGVTETMATRVSRSLLDSLVEGVGPREAGRRLAKETDFSRDQALTVARTEIIRAHAEGQLDAMEELGVEEVGAAVEWSTTGDGRVCKLCAPLNGIVLKLDEAHNLLPRHPNCRCAWVPANVGEDTSGQKRSKRLIDAALKKSQLKARISKRRPKSVFNVFCPTGEGGGIDPSCSPGGAKGGVLTGGHLKEIDALSAKLTESLREIGYNPATPFDHPLSMSYTRIQQYQQGTLVHKESWLEEDARKTPELRAHFEPLRQRLRELVGDHVILYRGADETGGIPGKFLSSYAPEKAVASKFLEGYDSSGNRIKKVLKEVRVPIDAIFMAMRTPDRPLEFMVQNDRLPKHLSTNSPSLSGNQGAWESLLETIDQYASNGGTENRSFFADCPRDPQGHCLPAGSGQSRASEEELHAVQQKARDKANNVPQPSKEEVKAAKEGIAELGANKFRRNLVGNTKDRAKRRQALLTEFGDGKTCPCIYCGLKVGEGTLEQDKIKTTAQGGRYRTPNLVPACGSCNKMRGDTPWEDIKWSKKTKKSKT